MAQAGALPIKTTEDLQIDYKKPGAPLPELKYILFQDTAAKKGVDGKTAKNDTAVIKTQASPDVSGDNSATTKGRSRKKRHHGANPTDNTEGVKKSILTNKDLDNGADLFVMMFNPTCSHCQDETRILEKNSALFKRSKIILLANPNMVPYMSDFIKYTDIDQYPFMYMGIDSASFISKVFLYQALPQINIYDENRKLIKTFTGEVAIDSLSKYIQ